MRFCSKADIRPALLNFYFAARQNSTFASLVLGYRHSTGLGVPRSCASAALYYNPAAEAVIREAAGPYGIPQLDRLRLSVKTLSSLNWGRDQEVLQYYQNSADLGNVEAQTAVGHLLTQGAQGLEVDYKQVGPRWKYPSRFYLIRSLDCDTFQGQKLQRRCMY